MKIIALRPADLRWDTALFICKYVSKFFLRVFNFNNLFNYFLFLIVWVCVCVLQPFDCEIKMYIKITNGRLNGSEEYTRYRPLTIRYDNMIMIFIEKRKDPKAADADHKCRIIITSGIRM